LNLTPLRERDNPYLLASPIDFLDYSLPLWELLKVVLWSKALGMSSAFYLVAVLGDFTTEVLMHAYLGRPIMINQGHLKVL